MNVNKEKSANLVFVIKNNEREREREMGAGKTTAFITKLLLTLG